MKKYAGEDFLCGDHGICKIRKTTVNQICSACFRYYANVRDHYMNFMTTPSLA